jgi:hypothetical protein
MIYLANFLTIFNPKPTIPLNDHSHKTTKISIAQLIRTIEKTSFLF